MNQDVLAAMQRWLENRRLQREMRNNAPKGTGKKATRLKRVTCEGVGSARSGKVFKWRGMPCHKAAKLSIGDGVSVMVWNKRAVGVVSRKPVWQGKRLEVQISYTTIFRRKPVMVVGTFYGYKGARMQQVLLPETDNKLDF